ALTLLGEFQWFNWDRFKEVRVNFSNGGPDLVRPQDFRDTYAAAVGAEYDLTDHLRVTGGLQYDRTPTVDQFRNTSLPDASRIWLGLGGTYTFDNGISIDAAISHAFMPSSEIDLTQSFFAGSPAAGQVVTKAHTDNGITTVSISMRYRF